MGNILRIIIRRLHADADARVKRGHYTQIRRCQVFSVRQKREISEAVQQILRNTNHPELPTEEIKFLLHVDGASQWSWADIRNNGEILDPVANQWNEKQDGV